MNCPKCGTQNPQDVQVCTSCGSELAQPPAPAESVKVKTSRLAIASFTFSILIPFVLFFGAMLNSLILAIIYLALVISSLVLGIISLVRIGLSAGRLTGRGFAVIGVVLPLVVFFGRFGLLYLADISYSIPHRMVCGTNLSGIGRAMLIYANDYDNSFPRAGGPSTKWGTTPNWQAENRIDAFGLRPDGTGGSATISSSLYLLVKYAEVTPKSFCCKQDPSIRAFKASDYTPLMEDEDAWDFGPNPTKHCSFSYHMCYGPYPLSTESSEPGMAVAADRNPWLDPYTDTSGFKWDDKTKTGGREDIKRYQKGNSGPHQREGQNVLFMDNHVYFEIRPFCGVNDDNIYTYWDGPDIQQGAPPVIGSQPADKLDSLLVNDPPLNNSK